jgi:hypothetical protein
MSTELTPELLAKLRTIGESTHPDDWSLVDGDVLLALLNEIKRLRERPPLQVIASMAPSPELDQFYGPPYTPSEPECDYRGALAECHSLYCPKHGIPKPV